MITSKREIQVRKNMFRQWQKDIAQDPAYTVDGDIMDQHDKEACDYCGSGADLYAIGTRHIPTGQVKHYVVCFLCWEQMEVVEDAKS